MNAFQVPCCLRTTVTSPAAKLIWGEVVRYRQPGAVLPGPGTGEPADGLSEEVPTLRPLPSADLAESSQVLEETDPRLKTRSFQNRTSGS